MKIIYKLMIVLGLILALSSCVTTKTPKEEFIVDMDTPKIEMGEIEVQFDRILALIGLKKNKVAVSYFPEEDAVCLQYRFELITYYQFWSRNGREAFTNALLQYINNYDERNLSRNGRKTLKSYDTVQGYLIWQLHRFSVKAKANMDVELGYLFKGKSPYFTVNQRGTLYIDSTGSDNNRDSPAITMFFTRAQAIELASLFDPEHLSGLALPEKTTERKSANVEKDDY